MTHFLGKTPSSTDSMKNQSDIGISMRRVYNTTPRVRASPNCFDDPGGVISTIVLAIVCLIGHPARDKLFSSLFYKGVNVPMHSNFAHIPHITPKLLAHSFISHL